MAGLEHLGFILLLVSAIAVFHSAVVHHLGLPHELTTLEQQAQQIQKTLNETEPSSQSIQRVTAQNAEQYRAGKRKHLLNEIAIAEKDAKLLIEGLQSLISKKLIEVPEDWMPLMKNASLTPIGDLTFRSHTSGDGRRPAETGLSAVVDKVYQWRRFHSGQVETGNQVSSKMQTLLQKLEKEKTDLEKGRDELIRAEKQASREKILKSIDEPEPAAFPLSDQTGKHKIIALSDEEFRHEKLSKFVSPEHYGDAGTTVTKGLSKTVDGTCEKDYGTQLAGNWRSARQDWCTPFAFTPQKLEEFGIKGRDVVQGTKIVCYPYTQTGHTATDNLCTFENVVVNFAVLSDSAVTSEVMQKYVKSKHMEQPYVPWPSGTLRGACHKSEKWEDKKLPTWYKTVLNSFQPVLPPPPPPPSPPPSPPPHPPSPPPAPASKGSDKLKDGAKSNQAVGSSPSPPPPPAPKGAGNSAPSPPPPPVPKGAGNSAPSPPPSPAPKEAEKSAGASKPGQPAVSGPAPKSVAAPSPAPSPPTGVSPSANSPDPKASVPSAGSSAATGADASKAEAAALASKSDPAALAVVAPAAKTDTKAAAAPSVKSESSPSAPALKSGTADTASAAPAVKTDSAPAQPAFASPPAKPADHAAEEHKSVGSSPPKAARMLLEVGEHRNPLMDSNSPLQIKVWNSGEQESTDTHNRELLDDQQQWWKPLECDERVEWSALWVQRDTFANFFHDSEDFFNVFLTLAILDYKVSQVRTMVMDLFPQGPFWDMWIKVFSTPDKEVISAWELKNRFGNKKVCFNEIAVAIIGPASPFTIHSSVTPCAGSPLMKAYSDFIIRGVGLHPYTYFVQKEPPKIVVVTWMARRPSVEWPEKHFCNSEFFTCDHFSHLGIRQIGRVLKNEPEAVDKLSDLETHKWTDNRQVIFRPKDYNLLSLVEQIKVDIRTDVMVGPHGAGLWHSIFMPDRAHLVELSIDGSGGLKHFCNAAIWRRNKDQYTQFKDAKNPVDVNKLFDLVSDAAQKVDLSRH